MYSKQKSYIITTNVYNLHIGQLWWELTNQNIFPIKIICKQKHINLKNGDWEIQSCVVERNKIFPNFDPVNGL
jgi:hypothetical protein